MGRKVLYLLPLVMAVFIAGLLIGGRIGANLTLWWVVMACAVVMIAAGVRRLVTRKSEKAETV